MRRFKHISTITADKRADFDHYPAVICVRVCSILSCFFMGSLKMKVFWGSELLKCLKHDIVKYLTIYYFSIYLSSLTSFSELCSSFSLYPFPNLSLYSDFFIFFLLASIHPTPLLSLCCNNLIGVLGRRCQRPCFMAERDFDWVYLDRPTMCCPAGSTLAPYAGHCTVA